MSEAVIRSARIQDASAIAQIYAPYVANTTISFEEVAPDAAEIAARIQISLEKYAYLVAELDGEIVGYAYGVQYGKRAAYRWSVETSIYLKQGFKHMGLGKKLYEELLPALKNRGYQVAIAVITLPNAASIGFHTALGFELSGVEKKIGWKHGKWLDVSRYQKRLVSGTAAPVEPS